jgi:flavin-dependent dehydrogenase
MMDIDELPAARVVSRTWDVIVVGAGPAGSMAARVLAGSGLSVLLVDQAAYPRWKVCGCCVNPFALNLLAGAGLGDLMRRCGAVPLQRMRLAARRHQADVMIHGWQALSRERLDAALVESAVRRGALFLSRTHVSLGSESPHARTVVLHHDNAQVEAAAKLILAANGLGSRLLVSECRGDLGNYPGSRIGAGVVTDTAPDFYQAGIVYMAYGTGGYIGMVRLEDGRLNLAAALDVNFVRQAHSAGGAAERLIREVGWPAVPGLLDLRWRGTPALTRQPTRTTGERILAVGDAAGYVEPFTGEGIGWAMASGLAVTSVAVRAVRAWDPLVAENWASIQGYCRSRCRRLCRAMAWLSRRPTLSRVMIGIVNRLPRLANPLLKEVARGGGYRGILRLGALSDGEYDVPAQAE